MLETSPLPLGVSLEIEVQDWSSQLGRLKMEAVADRVELKGDVALATPHASMV